MLPCWHVECTIEVKNIIISIDTTWHWTEGTQEKAVSQNLQNWASAYMYTILNVKLFSCKYRRHGVRNDCRTGSKLPFKFPVQQGHLGLRSACPQCFIPCTVWGHRPLLPARAAQMFLDKVLLPATAGPATVLLTEASKDCRNCKDLLLSWRHELAKSATAPKGWALRTTAHNKREENGTLLLHVMVERLQRTTELGVVPGVQTARAERYAEHSRCGISSTCAHKGLQ